MPIVDLVCDNEEAIQQCAALLLECLMGWPDLPSALKAATPTSSIRRSASSFSASSRMPTDWASRIF